MKVEHLPLLTSVSAPTVHPDASRAVVSATRADFAADAYVGQLWSVPLDGSAPPRRITRGFRDTAPRFSPDGRVLAFLRSEPAGRAQLCIVDAAGGEPTVITDQPLGVDSFAWSPDSLRIALAARVPAPGRYGTLDGVGPGAEDARLVDAFKSRANGLGYTADQPQQLFVLDVPSVDAEPAIAPVGRAKAAGPAPATVPEARVLTSAPADHVGPVFTPDGGRLVFSASLHSGADGDLRSDIYSIDLAGKDLVQLSRSTGMSRLSAHAAVVSNDGRWLFFLAAELGESGTDFVAAHEGVYVAPYGLDGVAGEARRLTEAAELDFGDTPANLLPWGPDAVIGLVRSRGAAHLVRVAADGRVETLLAGERVVTGAGVAGDAVVASFVDSSTAGDAGVVDRDGALARVSDFSAGFRAEAGVLGLMEAVYDGADGHPVHGWMLLPEGEGPHPVLLTIHGGPFSQYGWGLFDEAQVYASAGYAVLMCNPRGSAGYGFDHGRAIKEAMGTVDMADVLAFLEGALASTPTLDADRVGIQGGSYGGYLSAWTISQDHRFTAAIVERGYLDPASFVGSSDIGWFFSAGYTGTDPAAVAAQSPMAQVGSVRTPTLVVHSENDLRCPLEQAQRYYTALKMQGVPTAMLVFLGENHELSRTGTPHHRKQRFEAILDWWARHLPTAANPAPAGAHGGEGPGASVRAAGAAGD
ncbi:S9 family peptidase [Pseudarthrobacter sp. P1]|uniref:S9 family peptidase n=1 Tax=Pseudarthrobacter sp. P1 TaxID=3418418 RepID=UPI003CF853F5